MAGKPGKLKKAGGYLLSAGSLLFIVLNMFSVRRFFTEKLRQAQQQ